eukprot:TRINITY_DN5308_c0_g1_i2.p1 TRINITY_DN5308_c0_g1~~TRINITY_DN5308_c0_g1_i2.p1  ORF type:complete len:221 (+),score=10.67 TRINITY_DN5308_c0_g1_i2:228-890(+)
MVLSLLCNLKCIMTKETQLPWTHLTFLYHMKPILQTTENIQQCVHLHHQIFMVQISKKYSTDSKTFACTVNSSSALQSVFHHHSLVFISDKDNKDCGCTFNPTPTGQYVVGATIKLYGFYDQNMEYSNIYKRSGCEVEIQYSPNPLRDGDIFQQTIITVDISSWWDHNSLSVIFFFIAAAPLIVLIVIVVAIVLIVRSCIRSSGPHHQKNADKNNAYVVL